MTIDGRNGIILVSLVYVHIRCFEQYIIITDQTKAGTYIIYLYIYIVLEDLYSNKTATTASVLPLFL